MIGAFGVLPGDTNTEFPLNLRSEFSTPRTIGMIQDYRITDSKKRGKRNGKRVTYISHFPVCRGTRQGHVMLNFICGVTNGKSLDLRVLTEDG